MILKLFLAFTISYSLYSDDAALVATAQLVEDGLQAIQEAGTISQTCSAGTELPNPCLAKDGDRQQCSIVDVEKCTNYRFYYDQNSSCGGYGGSMLSFLSTAGRLLSSDQQEIRQAALGTDYKPAKELKLSAGDIIQVESNPDRRNSQTKVNIFIPMERFECIPVPPEECNSNNRKYAQYVNGSMNDRRAAFPNYPCGGKVVYYLPGAEPIVDNWNGAASTYHKRCNRARAYFTSGMQEVSSSRALHPLGICLNFLTEADTKTHSRNDRSDPDNPAELDFCFSNGSIGNEVGCVGELPPPEAKPELVPSIAPTPTAIPASDKNESGLSQTTCCGGGYKGTLLCTNYMVAGYTNFSFHIVECVGDGTWGETLAQQQCGNPAHECCFAEKYSDWQFAKKCIDILTSN